MPIEERVVKEWTQLVNLDIMGLFLGDRISSGLSREVFECGLDDKLVAKIEDTQYRQNEVEWLIWESVVGTKWEKWFAGIRHCSPCMSCIIQDKTTIPTEEDWKKFPRKIPEFLADARKENWGILDGRFVVHDYGYTNLIYDGLKAAKLIDTKSKRAKRTRVQEA